MSGKALTADVLAQLERQRVLRLLLKELADARKSQPDWYRWVVERRQRRLGADA